MIALRVEIKLQDHDRLELNLVVDVCAQRTVPMTPVLRVMQFSS